MAQSIVESKSRNIEKIRQPYVELSKSFGGTGNLLRNPLDEAISERGTLDNILGGQ
jgi:hypothetical protein